MVIAPRMASIFAPQIVTGQQYSVVSVTLVSTEKAPRMLVSKELAEEKANMPQKKTPNLPLIKTKLTMIVILNNLKPATKVKQFLPKSQPFLLTC